METTVFKKEITYYRESKIEYLVAASGDDIPEGKRVCYIYDAGTDRENIERIQKLKKDDKLILKPQSVVLTTQDDKGIQGSFANGYSGRSYVKIYQTPEELGLHIPVQYQQGELKQEYKHSDMLTDEMLEQIKKMDQIAPLIITGQNMSNIIGNEHTSEDYERYCYKCGEKYYSKVNGERYGITTSCPKCGNSAHNNEIVMKSFKEWQKKHYRADYYNSRAFSDTPTTRKEYLYYMKTHPDNENGIILYKICREISTETDTITTSYNVEYTLEHIVGEKICCTKFLKRSNKPANAFDMLNINTKNINATPRIIYEESDDFFDFASKHEKFMKYSGFLSLLKYSSISLDLEPFFIVFLGILNQYPILEQIIKMGHAKLYYNLYDAMRKCLNKEEINNNVRQLSQIVDNEATKGKDALRFPTYIGDYLIKKNAPIEEYYYWRDLYEITNIDKNNFETFTDSFNFAWINSQIGLEDIGNILKFGYTIEKLFNYIVKQCKKNDLIADEVVSYLSDYLTMCDMMQVEADKFPSKVKKLHDDMLIHYRKYNEVENDKKLAIIGAECEKYVIPDEKELEKIGIPKLFKEYTIVFPKSEKDFINEGNMQHNCVGSYPPRVKRGDCIIFFIRKKETPRESFITAECKGNGLGQCFLSNNRFVGNEDIINFAKYIANKIKTGCRSGKIHGLNNI